MEVFVPENNYSCELSSNLTTYGHSQNGLLRCGGGYLGDGGATSRSCYNYSFSSSSSSSSWTREPYNLTQSRSNHVSWALKNGSVLLIGGYTEESANNSEIVTPGLGSLTSSLKLEYPLTYF